MSATAPSPERQGENKSPCSPEPSHQQVFYEDAYAHSADDAFGFPDRKIVDRELPHGKRILTIGGGRANDLWYLAAGNSIINVDYAMAGLRGGLEHGISGIVADVNWRPVLPFRDRSFDIVVCKDILEHVLQPLTVVEEVRRVLRDDGYVIINVPNHFYWRMRLRILLGNGIIWRGAINGHDRDYREWDYMHVRFFTYRGFRDFLAAGQLDAEKFFWDFGTLAHYCQPDMWFEPQLWKLRQGQPLSPRARVAVSVGLPLWRLFNVICPPALRRFIVSLAPGFFCSSFYVRARKAGSL